MKLIPTAVLMPIVEQRLVLERAVNLKDTRNERLTMLAHRCGIRSDSLIKTLNNEYVEFDLADLMLCKLGAPFLWWVEPLSEFYWAGDLEPSRRLTSADGSRVCERRGCSNRFTPHPLAPKKGPKRRRYCSGSCASLESQYRRGVAKRKSYGTCKSGLHEMTPENTITMPPKPNSVTGSSYQVCRACKNENQARYRTRHRENSRLHMQRKRAREREQAAAA